MAHAAKLNQLAGGLVTSTTGKPNDSTNFGRLHDRALKGLKNTSHARTNQFEIQSKISGLIEKFTILNRGDLAEGLQTRLDELPSKSKWLPEILSLLLELSDRPLEKTRMEDVEAASKIEEEQPTLTWQDIIAEDPLDEPGIWDDVERGYHSSDDDFTDDEDGSGDDTQATSFIEDPVALAESFVVQVDDGALNQVRDCRENLAVISTGSALSELTLIREALSMLHGLPTSVFDNDIGTGHVTVASNIKLDTASGSVLNDILHQLAATGSTLNALRLWTKAVSYTHL